MTRKRDDWNRQDQATRIDVHFLRNRVRLGALHHHEAAAVLQDIGLTADTAHRVIATVKACPPRRETAAEYAERVLPTSGQPKRLPAFYRSSLTIARSQTEVSA